MSNLIKSRYVYLDGGGKKVIDSNGKVVEKLQFTDSFREISFGEVKPSEGEEKKEGAVFTEGLKAPVIEPALSGEDEALLHKKAEQILSEAREEAGKLLEEAGAEAEERSKLLYEEARRKGYDEGFSKAALELEQKKKEYEELEQKLEADYEEQIGMLEPQYGQLVAELVERLTGILTEDKKEVILYLLHNAITKSDNSKSYRIRVSKEDYDFVASKQEELQELLKGDALFEVFADKELKKNQCLIETDTRIIDCSLDVQLSNLVQSIKMLSRQND